MRHQNRLLGRFILLCSWARTALRPRDARACVIARILYRPRAGRLLKSTSSLPSKRTRARGTPRVPEDPRASTPRDIEACRSGSCRKSTKPMASRARRLRFAPQRPRWTDLSGTFLSAKAPIHRYRPRRRGGKSDYCPVAAISGPRGARLAHRDEAAWTAGRAFASNLQRASRPPLPAQRLKTLIKRPS